MIHLFQPTDSTCPNPVYGIAAPVIPFRLEHLGYSDVESLTGWLVAGESSISKMAEHVY